MALILPSTSASTTSERLLAYVVATNAGPLQPCSDECTPDNSVWHFIRVINANRLTNFEGGTNRATVPNAYVIDSIDERIFVDGVEHPEFAGTWTPPPNISPPQFPSYSGHWVSTATCPPEGPPCNVVGSPAFRVPWIVNRNTYVPLLAADRDDAVGPCFAEGGLPHLAVLGAQPNGATWRDDNVTPWRRDWRGSASS